MRPRRARDECQHAAPETSAGRFPGRVCPTDPADLSVAPAEADAAEDAVVGQVRAALEGLGRAIDAQFDAWRLTPAERAVALLVLKGYGHKQIAALTERSERTVRQHAGAVYEKAGLGGRAELSAYFLQDLMLPEPERGVLQASGPAAAAHG